LRIEKSIDYFVLVSSKIFEKTCFGMSLEDLMLLNNNSAVLKNTLNSTNTNNNNNNNNNNPSSNSVVNNTQQQQIIPKEIWRLVDVLFIGKTLQEKNLFFENGDANEVFFYLFIFLIIFLKL
jgi:hypothetical protein